MGLAVILPAIAAKVTAAIDELQVSPIMLDDPTPPAAHVYPSPTDYDAAFQGSDKWLVTLQILVSTAAGSEGAQLHLLEYIEGSGPRSVKAALEATEEGETTVTLGGLIDDLRVVRNEGFRLYVREGRPLMLGSEWSIEVYADRD